MLHFSSEVCITVPEKRTGYLLKRIHDAIKTTADARLRSMGLTFSQVRVLRYLQEEKGGGPALQKETETYFGVAHPTMVGILQRLESKGLVRVKTCEEDRRMRTVTLTEKGLAIHEKMQEHVRRNDGILSRGFSTEEIEQLNGYLVRILDNLSESEKEELL